MDNSSKTQDNKAQEFLIGRLASFVRMKDGVVSIEAALLFPFMILMFLGMIDLSHVFSIKRKVAVAASAVADLTTQETASVTTGDLDQFILAADAILKPFSSTETKVEVTNYRRSGNSVNQEWAHSRGGCGGAQPSGASLNNLTAEDNDIIVAKVCLSFQPLVGYVIGTSGWYVEEIVSQRPRNGLTLDCSNC